MSTAIECLVHKKGCLKKIKPGGVYYKAKIEDGSVVVICSSCLREGAAFESIEITGAITLDKDNKATNVESAKAKANPASRKNRGEQPDFVAKAVRAQAAINDLASQVSAKSAEG